MLTLLAGWTLPFASPVLWTTFVLATIALPALLPFLTGLVPHRRGIAKRSHARAVATTPGLCRVARGTGSNVAAPTRHG